MEHRIVADRQQSPRVSLQSDTKFTQSMGVTKLKASAFIDATSVEHDEENVTRLDSGEVAFEHFHTRFFDRHTVGDQLDNKVIVALRKEYIESSGQDFR